MACYSASQMTSIYGQDWQNLSLNINGTHSSLQECESACVCLDSSCGYCCQNNNITTKSECEQNNYNWISNTENGSANICGFYQNGYAPGFVILNLPEPIGAFRPLYIWLFCSGFYLTTNGDSMRGGCDSNGGLTVGKTCNNSRFTVSASRFNHTVNGVSDKINTSQCYPTNIPYYHYNPNTQSTTQGTAILTTYAQWYNSLPLCPCDYPGDIDTDDSAYIEYDNCMSNYYNNGGGQCR